jgi:hypothetical protein
MVCGVDVQSMVCVAALAGGPPISPEILPRPAHALLFAFNVALVMIPNGTGFPFMRLAGQTA